MLVRGCSCRYRSQVWQVEKGTTSAAGSYIAEACGAEPPFHTQCAAVSAKPSVTSVMDAVDAASRQRSVFVPPLPSSEHRPPLAALC